MMKSSNKTTILLGISLVLAIIVGGAYIYFFIAIKNKNKSIAEFLSKNEELAGRETRLRLSKSSLKMEQSNIDKLSSYFVKESDIVSFTKKIEALGAESRTTLSLELLEPGVAEGNVPVLNFRVKAKGGFAEVMKLTMLFENYPVEFEWRSVHLVRDDSGDASKVAQNTKASRPATPQWIITISLSAFNFLKE